MIPIQWNTSRNNCYVNIDCYIFDEQGTKQLVTEICRECTEGCNIEAFNWDPSEGIRVQLFDKGGKLLDQSKWEKNVDGIVIDKDEFLKMKISFEYEQ